MRCLYTARRILYVSSVRVPYTGERIFKRREKKEIDHERSFIYDILAYVTQYTRVDGLTEAVTSSVGGGGVFVFSDGKHEWTDDGGTTGGWKRRVTN